MADFSWVTKEAYEQAARLLEENGLPTADLDPERVTLLVARGGGVIVGTAGLEAAGEFGLFRSLAVAREMRGQGLARAMFEQILSEARRRGFRRLYGLTTTADAVLERLGFSLVERAEVPGEIRETKQFSSLCPASTRAFVLSLTSDSE